MPQKVKITISPNGDSVIEGMEQSDDCYKLSELGKAAGKVVSEKKKEHIPVYQNVHNKQ